ncbi:MAG: RDD family protein, partial [Gallionella sp.]
IGLLALFYLAGFFVSAAYFTLMEAGERGATYGKRALNIRVSDAAGNRISTARALGRWFGHWITNCTFYIGYLMQPFTEKKQALHDMVSSTVVIETNEKSRGAGVVIAIVLGILMFIVLLGILAAIAIPAYQTYTSKAKLVAVYRVANQATNAVASFYVTHQQTPATLIEAGYQSALPAVVDNVLYDATTGEVQVVTSASLPRDIARKHLVYTPSVRGDGSVEWVCHSSDMAENYLNTACK